ncbi:hypothetical protein [Gracilibacillus phocaeensis]|uniref:hypothetical protein n=1 Tax=Gracilibacillus phocaeensis TaxID=2042304 RepID=UPI0010323812|nr:hypothetical protein [Gracilibacillus phocaeensis]
MIKMAKRMKDTILYWEVWQDGKYLVIHHGTVGDTGESEKQKVPVFQKGQKIMGKLAKEKAAEGFDYLDEDKLFQVVIQYTYEENEMEAAFDLRQSIEELMNECLGWTGNGACDGGDIGQGTVNIFNYVIDVNIAAKTIIEELKYIGILEQSKLAYVRPGDDAYITLYPEEATFDLM